MNGKRLLELFDEALSHWDEGEGSVIARSAFLEALLPQDLSEEEHNARGAAELIRVLAQSTAKDFPNMSIDIWVRKIDAYCDALLDGKPIPVVQDAYQIGMSQILLAANLGKFKDVPAAYSFDNLVSDICDWLKKDRPKVVAYMDPGCSISANAFDWDHAMKPGHYSVALVKLEDV